MSTFETEEQSVKKPTKRWRYGCLAFFTLFLLLSAVYYIGGRADGNAVPWTWNRGDAEKRTTASFFTSHLGVTTSRSGATIGTSRAHSDTDGVDFSSVVVRSASTHPLSVISAERLAEKLKTIPAIQRVEFVPHGPIIAKDEPLPQWVVQVNVDNLNERRMPNRSLSGVIEVTSGISFGGVARREASAYGNTAPLVGFTQHSSNDVRVTHTGISSQSFFYRKIAEDVANRVVKAIETEFDKLSSAHPTLPKLPEAFYPAYREASDVPPIPGLVSQTIIADGRRLMQPHYSLVQIESNFNGTFNEFLTAIQEAMNDAGWSGRVGGQGLQLTKGNETFFMFQERPSRTRAADADQIPETHAFLIERTERMDDDSILAAIQTLLDEDVPISAFLPFTWWISNRNSARSSFITIICLLC